MTSNLIKFLWEKEIMRNSIISLLFLSFTAILLSCASRNPIVSKSEIIDYPSLNLPHKAEFGDIILKKSQIYTYDELELLSQTDCHFVGMRVMTIFPGKL